MSRGTARVLVFYRSPDDDPDAVVRLFHEVSGALQGTPGLLRSELLRDRTTAGRYAVLSEWESWSAFRAWDEGPDHRDQTAPLRPYQARPEAVFGAFELAAAY